VTTSDLDAIPDPDETGTDTFARYRYQAQCSFAECMRCALTGDVASVTPERLEDLLVEEPGRWRFIQVKTRDAGRGPWLFGDLLDDGGALHSVLRTHLALGDFDDGRDRRYEIHLEGAAKRGDSIENLLIPSGTGPTAEMAERCRRRLKCTAAVAQAVLDRTRVRDQLPPRSLIRDHHIRNLQRYAPGLLPAVTEAVYDAVIDAIEAAMRGELLADQWPHAVMEAETVQEEVRAKVEAKRLTAALLGPLFEPLGAAGSAATLEVITDVAQLSASELERKLIAAGATDALRRDAKQLRANASRLVFESVSGSLETPDAALVDIDMRLLVAARAVAATVTSSPPAAEVWKGALDDYTVKRESLDPMGLLAKDPMFLLGRLCELSDRCQFAWGA
jgi:hypothetical protein